MSYTELNSGVKLGGPWKEMHDKCVAACEARDQAFLERDRAFGECDVLRSQLESLKVEYRNNMASLTKHQTNNWQMESILDTIKEEKAALESKCIALESQVAWLDRQRDSMQSDIDERTIAFESLTMQYNLLKANKEHTENVNFTLNETLIEKSHCIEHLENELRASQKTNEILTKSLKGKENILSENQKLIKSLEKQIDALKLSIIPKYRNMVNLKMMELDNKQKNRKANESESIAKNLQKKFDSVMTISTHDNADTSNENISFEDTSHETSGELDVTDGNVNECDGSNVTHGNDSSNANSNANSKSQEQAHLKNELLCVRLENKALKDELQVLRQALSCGGGSVKGSFLKSRNIKLNHMTNDKQSHNYKNNRVQSISNTIHVPTSESGPETPLKKSDTSVNLKQVDLSPIPLSPSNPWE